MSLSLKNSLTGLGIEPSPNIVPLSFKTFEEWIVHAETRRLGTIPLKNYLSLQIL